MDRRDFLKRFGLGAASLGAGAALGDEWVDAAKSLPEGSVGDPRNVWFGQRIFPIPHTIEDGPSCRIENGKIVMPAREVPVFHRADVAVVGGGPAGFAAAVASARAGAKTVLIEKSGSLGGLFTNGMVLLMLCSSAREDGKYRLVTRGICEEFMTRAQKMGPYASTGPVPETRHWQPTVDPEAAKYLMDSMCAEAGVETFFHASGIDVVQEGDAVRGVVFSSKQGFQAVLASQVVDCTGDGDVFFAAGCGYRQITHGIGFTVRLGNIDKVTAKEKPPKRDDDPIPRRWPVRSNEGNPATWWGGALGPKGDGLSVRDLSRAEVEHRRRWWKHVEIMRGTPGWEKTFILNTCSQIGPRATRLLESEVIFDRAAAAAGTEKDNAIGWFGDDGPHAAMPIPYGALVPRRGDNVLAAGRCIGAPDTIDTFRLICPCFVTGQAAGTAAALAAARSVTPRSLPVADLRRRLAADGVFLG
ncbi:MAG: FAD-dependent oxidoreductase [Kiritimatiellae bacterium]|nr:FAD-dependent oxidoreductase [Kiritimatiellia bacterium]